MTTRVSAIFPDGAMYVAPTYRALEDVLMADAWNPSDPATYRKVMAERAVVWSGWHLNADARAETFLRGMEKAGMLRLEVETSHDTINQTHDNTPGGTK